MAYVYCHYKIGSSPKIFYIGVGGLNKFDNYKRAAATKARSNFWKMMSSKVNWGWEIIYDNLTKEEAFEKEKELINIYGRYDIKKGTLANLTDGGEGGLGGGQSLKNKKRDPLIFIKGKETLRKRGGFKHSKISKEKISKATKGKNNPFYGKKHNIETLNKLAEINSIPVLNIETGIFYNSIKEACNTTDISYADFKRMLSNLSENKTSFIRLK